MVGDLCNCRPLALICPAAVAAGQIKGWPPRRPNWGGGDERVPQRVGADVLGAPGAAGYPADDPGGAVPVQPPPVRGDEQRTFGALADRQLDRLGGTRREGDGGCRSGSQREIPH